MEKGISKLQNSLDNLYVARAELHAGMQKSGHSTPDSLVKKQTPQERPHSQ